MERKMANSPRSRMGLLRRWRGRLRARGAAMVEGAVVATFFVLMFNLTVWISGTYLAKIETVNVGRYQEFYYASHNCDKNPPAYTTRLYPGGNSNPGKEGEQGKDGLGKEADGEGTGQGGPTVSGGDAPTSNFFVSTVTAKGQFAWRSWMPTNEVTAVSRVMCNEGPYGANILSYLGNMISGILGSIF